MHDVHRVRVMRAFVVEDVGEADEEGGYEDLARLVQNGIPD